MLELLMEDLKPLALISVYNKSGLDTLAPELVRHGYRLLSTGGSAQYLRELGLEVIDIEDFTGFPSILDQRVKTLHPKIHGGILYNRLSESHNLEAKRHDIKPISMVIVNFYPFEDNALKKHLDPKEGIEFIDIGGPTMIRAAAKNWEFCTPIIDPTDYPEVVSKLQSSSTFSPEFKLKLAAKVFAFTQSYDHKIAQYLCAASTSAPQPSESLEMDTQLSLDLQKETALRYGENPQQSAAFYTSHDKAASAFPTQLQGKQLSYNNYLDTNAGLKLLTEFDEEAFVAIIKHNNPCGCAAGEGSTQDLYKKALEADPVSAFGGIVVTNQVIDKDTSLLMNEIFLECILAKDYTDEASEILSKKKNLRLLKWNKQSHEDTNVSIKSIFGGYLVQSPDMPIHSETDWRVVAGPLLEKDLEKELRFAMKIASHAKSNAIVFTKGLQTLSIGAGHTSRIDALEFAAYKARKHHKSLQGSVMASDAFFPFDDCVKFAHTLGVKAIVQPGGSIRDQDSINAAKEAGITLVFSGHRHFNH